MKQVYKIGVLLGAAISVWIALLLSTSFPSAYASVLPYLPVYAVVALGCYGIGAVGYGVMLFPTCPQEAVLLQKVLTSNTYMSWVSLGSRKNLGGGDNNGD